LNPAATEEMNQKQEKGHAAVPFSSVGLQWVASCDILAVPYDFVFRSNNPTEGAVILVVATVAGDQDVNTPLLK
jgi:hypothetical protein